MTQKNLIEKVVQFQNLFGLNNYQISVGFKKTSQEIEGAAEVNIMRDYKRASIFFASDEYKSWSEEEAQETACHEIVHIVLNQIQRIGIQAAEEGLNVGACNVVKSWMRCEDEAAVEAITDAVLYALRA